MRAWTTYHMAALSIARQAIAQQSAERGIDVSRDWLDVHCLADGHRCKLPNAPAGHAAVADLARDRDSVVCFESTGG